MGLHQKGDVFFRVARGANRVWNVSEKGLDEPLASFDSEKDACNYANDLAKAKPGSKVVVEGRKLVGTLSLPARR